MPISEQEFLEHFGDGLGIGGDADEELNLLRVGESVEPGDKLHESFLGLVAHELIEIIYVKMRDVIITGVDAADETLEELIGADVISAGIDKTGLIGDVIGELALLFDNNDVAVALVHCLAHEINQFLRLSRAFQTHNKLDHFDHAPFHFNVLVFLRGAPFREAPFYSLYSAYHFLAKRAIGELLNLFYKNAIDSQGTSFDKLAKLHRKNVDIFLTRRSQCVNILVSVL